MVKIRLPNGEEFEMDNKTAKDFAKAAHRGSTKTCTRALAEKINRAIVVRGEPI